MAHRDLEERFNRSPYSLAVVADVPAASHPFAMRAGAP